LTIRARLGFVTQEHGGNILGDRFGRPLRDLRVSVTDRCNFRCRYCMPREHYGSEHPFLPRAHILTFEEVSRFAGVMVGLGLRKVRLTGGEPLLRADLTTLVRLLAGHPGLEIALTTNGSLLERAAEPLARAGLHRLTVSLDALDEPTFQRMTDSECTVAKVLAGIRAAERAGFESVKINCVVRKGVNEHAVLDLARHFRGTGHVLRFIEYMDVGITNGWRLDEVVSAREILERIGAEAPLLPLEPSYAGEVARRYRYADGSGEIGLIASVSQPFCGNCARLRLSADGRLYTCLFASAGHDLKGLMRAGATDEALGAFVRELWSRRGDRYSELRSNRAPRLPRVEMSYIGG
jgi:cyclic pyranopterin phosphate synthase